MERKFDLEERLINFAVECINLFMRTNKSYALDHLSKQLIRSSTAAALNYGEVQGAESSKDFIHKMGIVLKELKESRVNLKIQIKANLLTEITKAESVLNECKQLVAIFSKSIQTAKAKK
ncbi:four helix bundle protein [Cochleicola gelatinilyticus]|uniref:Four helix bundle protein n=1 Tax=Cochleicola gelatinilyticus TaxID=1763537 RepID=A0A167IJ29_9FLAO|nr:four helix bundle protein [Cochleicola gelatinilyticus]OAB79706.1 four helix bundle protein [Cochleicola gelatinilyticus]